MKHFKNTRFFLFMLMGASISQYTFAQKKEVVLTKGMIITHSVTIKKQVYHFEGNDSLSVAPIIIQGENIYVVFNGATIEGSSFFDNLDKFKGSGVIVKSGHNIAIRNLVVKGFKAGLMAKGINKLSIEKCDFSYNYRQHLNSTRDREDLADWQSYHHNENDEWLRYGAGIYLRNCDYFRVLATTITNGQCGLMLTGCNYG